MTGLELNETYFMPNTNTRATAFFVFADSPDGLEYSVECCFQPNEFEQERVTPKLELGIIPTAFQKIEDIVGMTFEVKNIEEAYNREDLFYIFEQEPLVNYQLTILEYKEERMHVLCNGTAVNDGYAKPFTTATFNIDCWLPVITNIKDWGKYGL
ncbi:hypothetical protein IMSAGC011_02796 [Lachnospiraceae bacterium]|nr:hypothetical protein IMSAGC011_02796 [Lachnospiraceae bacterium]